MKFLESCANLIVISYGSRVLTAKRQYGKIVMPLQAVLEVMKHFDSYRDIPQIKQLADEVGTLMCVSACTCACFYKVCG